MSILQNYKGLQVLSPSPSGAGGLAINDDFKSLVDWNPRSNWSATVDPSDTDDSRESGPANNYQVGSLWYNTSTGALFVCVDATIDNAVWRGLPAGMAGMTVWNSTSDATPTELYLNGVDQQIVIPEGSVSTFEVSAVAKTLTSSNSTAVWKISGAVVRENGSNAAIVGANTYTEWKESGAATWDLDVSVSIDKLIVQATGASAAQVGWSAHVAMKSLVPSAQPPTS